jgi:hypothetical protein
MSCFCDAACGCESVGVGFGGWFDGHGCREDEDVLRGRVLLLREEGGWYQWLVLLILVLNELMRTVSNDVDGGDLRKQTTRRIHMSDESPVQD